MPSGRAGVAYIHDVLHLLRQRLGFHAAAPLSSVGSDVVNDRCFRLDGIRGRRADRLMKMAAAHRCGNEFIRNTATRVVIRIKKTVRETNVYNSVGPQRTTDIGRSSWR